MNIHGWINAVEAGWWFLLGILMVTPRVRLPKLTRRHRAILCVSLLAFGTSDVIEIRTGAWWRPWPLMLLKIVCVVIAVGTLLFAWFRERREHVDSEG